MQTSVVGRDLVKSFEGLKLKAYKDIVGVWTIGWGHTDGVYEGLDIDLEEAEDLLTEDLGKVERAIQILVKVPVNQNQYDALASFIFNVGVRAFRNSTLRRYLNEGDYWGAGDQFKRWNKAGGRAVAGLTRRREAEAKLFNTSV